MITGVWNLKKKKFSRNGKSKSLEEVYILDDKTKNIYDNLEAQISKIAKHTRQGSFKTRGRYYEAAKRFSLFLAEVYKIQRFANISDKHIEAYIDLMQSKGLSASTIKTDLSAIRYFLDHVDNPRNTLSKNEKYNLEKRVFGGVDRTWSQNEFEKMIKLAREQGFERVANAMELSRYLGFRIHEVFRIDRAIAEAALRNGRITIKGKGGKERTIELPIKARKVLEDIIQNVNRGQKLFVNQDEKTHIVIKEIQNWIDRNREYCIDPDRNINMTFHGLRHTRASLAYKEDIKLGMSELEARKNVSKLLGHERDDVTRIYINGRE